MRLGRNSESKNSLQLEIPDFHISRSVTLPTPGRCIKVRPNNGVVVQPLEVLWEVYRTDYGNVHLRR